ncbi:MAG: UDP-N-acetylglucosamine 2-epimerase (non-hydrolyzing), partial [Chloroflexi bacterium]
MKIFTVVGARPQFIKAAPLSRAIRQRHEEFLVHTGQHYDDAMSAVFFRQLGIPAPDVNLGVGSGHHGAQTAAMLQGIEALLLQEKPHCMLVYGDTNSTLAGALAASKLHIPIAHVEAGLRSYNRAMPEEINRVLTDHLSALLFCPTDVAVNNLAQEGITEGVIMCGDIMVDAVLQNVARARQESTILQHLSIAPKTYLAATIHRPANTDDAQALQAIIDAFATAPLPVIFAAHPRTQKALAQHGIQLHGNARLIEPLGYLDMLALV